MYLYLCMYKLCIYTYVHIAVDGQSISLKVTNFQTVNFYRHYFVHKDYL